MCCSYQRISHHMKGGLALRCLADQIPSSSRIIVICRKRSTARPTCSPTCASPLKTPVLKILSRNLFFVWRSACAGYRALARSSSAAYTQVRIAVDSPSEVSSGRYERHGISASAKTSPRPVLANKEGGVARRRICSSSQPRNLLTVASSSIKVRIGGVMRCQTLLIVSSCPAFRTNSTF